MLPISGIDILAQDPKVYFVWNTNQKESSNFHFMGNQSYYQMQKFK